jgi:hypothetical protein
VPENLLKRRLEFLRGEYDRQPAPGTEAAAEPAERGEAG